MTTYKTRGTLNGDDAFAVYDCERCIGAAYYNPRIGQWRATRYAKGKIIGRYFDSKAGVTGWLKRMFKAA